MCEYDLYRFPIQRGTEIDNFGYELCFLVRKSIILSSFDSFGMKTITRAKVRGGINNCQGTHQAQSPDHIKS